MLELVKKALRISTTAYDDELSLVISAALIDLGIAGIKEDIITADPDELDPLVKRAVITFCKLSFGLPEDYELLKASYDEQKAQMVSSSNYHDWLVTDNV